MPFEQALGAELDQEFVAQGPKTAGHATREDEDHGLGHLWLVQKSREWLSGGSEDMVAAGSLGTVKAPSGLRASLRSSVVPFRRGSFTMIAR